LSFVNIFWWLFVKIRFTNTHNNVVISFNFVNRVVVEIWFKDTLHPKFRTYLNERLLVFEFRPIKLREARLYWPGSIINLLYTLDSLENYTSLVHKYFTAASKGLTWTERILQFVLYITYTQLLLLLFYPLCMVFIKPILLLYGNYPPFRLYPCTTRTAAPNTDT
jgi:hypothetical protein